MFKVLVAEDELPLLRGIKRMIELTDPDFSVVFCASNGQEALDYLTQHTVDIVFTDINMPLMDGLELLTQLSDREEDLRTVVISGYDSFQYAQKAMRLGTCSYLLKPIDSNDLAELLSRFKEELSVKFYSQKREKLLRLLFEGAQESNVWDWGKLSLYYLCAGPFHSQPSPDVLPELVCWSDGALPAYLKQRTRAKGDSWLFWGQSYNEALIVLENVPDFSADELKCFLSERLSVPGYITIAAGPQDVKATGLGQILHRLRAGISRQGIFGQDTVIRWGQEPPVCNALPEFLLVQLQLFVQKQQTERVMHVLEQILEFFQQNGVTQFYLEEVLGRIILLIQGGSKEQWIDIQHSVQEMVTAAVNYEALLHELKVVCLDYLNNQPFDTNDKESLMKSVDEYIRENVSRPFTTNDLAKQFGLVAPYLSKLFKRYKGMSPSQYLHRIRMGRAKQILSAYPDLMIKDVAEQLGFTNALYFSKVFQKETGVYPSEFRAMCDGEGKIKKDEECL